MAAPLVSDIIQQAYEDIGVVQVGELVSPTLQTNGFLILNELLNSLSAEKYSVFTQLFGTYALQGGVSAYTLGVGGSFGTSVRAQRAVSWSAVYFNFRTGGPILSFPEFQAAAVDPIGVTSAIPKIVGADEAWPLINVRVFPIPATGGSGSIEIAYWTVIQQFVAVGDTISLPPGYFQMLHWNLAVLLYPKYARVGGMPPEVAAMAQNSKLSLVQQNSPAQQAAQ